MKQKCKHENKKKNNNKQNKDRKDQVRTKALVKG